MFKETFPGIIYALLLQDFPESLVETMAVFSLLNLRIKDRKILAIALLQTFTNLVRLLPIAFGVHSVILILSLAAYTRLFTRAQLSKIFLAVLLCFALIATAELLYAQPLLNLTGLEYEEVFANPFLRAAFALPYTVLLLVLALVKNYYNQKRGLVC
ncbi:hypothetical protein [Neomoorella humiferrea]|uniref:Uncharacterized protein n=1 Tax=Neomoorella humiferrea TaxID=676965 RepID=A0A2T0AWV8_9FIRM|nr:hypothetical protein [Moorella humiferrea]PRR75077.1 hypothetical protein MOHU_05840 [Moorella humiferrea]